MPPVPTGLTRRQREAGASQRHRWYNFRAMRGNQGLRACALAGVLSAGLAGCGGGERQDAKEKAGTYRVEVVDAAFPAKQSIAQTTEMRIRVRNADSKPLPFVAVTIETTPKDATGGARQAFSSDIQDTKVSDRSRPIWIVDDAPKGGDSAYTNTWGLGPLKPGATRTFRWKVTAVKPGDYTIDYRVSPGLNGKAKAASGAGTGTFKVNISDTPPDARVGDDGEVIKSAPSSDDAN
jgi:hypothetical protein